jgi:hypothetical protein
LHSPKEWKKVEYESARDFSADVTVEVGAISVAYLRKPCEAETVLTLFRGLVDYDPLIH